MERYAVLGEPVEHSLSPVIHACFAAQTGKQILYEQLQVSAKDFPAAVHRFREKGGRGINVTVPHKEAALRLADQVTPAAALANAANCLSFEEGGIVAGSLQPNLGGGIVAHNTDGSGLVRDLEDALGLKLGGMRILVLGAGGAAQGILGPLLDRSPERMLVANRTAIRAQALAEAHQKPKNLETCGLQELHEREELAFDLILNATAAGLSGASLDLPDSILQAGHTVCYELVYGVETDFIAWAKRAGCERVVDGLGMLVEQAADSFERWHGVHPDGAAARARLSALASHVP